MDKEGLILLNLVDSLTPQKILKILEVGKHPGKAFSITDKDLAKMPFLTQDDFVAIKRERDSKRFKEELDLIQKYKIEVLTVFDNRYPVLLKEIVSPPIVLYCQGDLRLLKNNLLSVVGSRKASRYGLVCACEFAKEIIKAGFTVVSGFARGIDTAAHQAALSANGATIAILGSGLLNLYPQENRLLAEEIKKKGLLVSEFPLTMKPFAKNFPRRNRIVSGLSLGVLVVEAAVRSGALITARLACEQNREVFVLPGNINSLLSRGNHKLIKEGAKLVENIDDILEELNVEALNAVL